MANTHETIADIIAAKRRLAAEMGKALGDQHTSVEMLKDDADRIEAAHKREIEATAAKCCQLGRLAGYGASEIKHQQEPVGDAAKLREALDESRRIASDLGGCRLNDYWKLNEIVRVCEAALAAPARNCDMPLVVDGPADNNADKAWIVFKRHNPDAYFDVPGLLRCIDWLLAPATEKEGGNK